MLDTYHEFPRGFWIVITIGEMIAAPVSLALVAKFSPEAMCGRYMAFIGYSWGIAFAIGPWLAGLIMDRNHPEWLWYSCGLIGTIAALGYLILHRWALKRSI